MTLATLDRKNPTDTREAPASAFRFNAASPVQFAARGAEQAQSKAVTLLARTGAPIDHWYWGRIVHDFAGMKAKEVIALDWNHDPNELIGKADKLDASSGNLMAFATIESIEVGDQADKIIKRSDRGVPYEASIYFNPWDMVLEYLPEGTFTEVNGAQVEGPLVIAREWTLRRIALVSSGADSGTEASFSSREDDAAKFSLNWKGPSMATKATDAGKQTADTKPADEGAGKQSAESTAGDKAKTPPSIPTTQLDKYVDKFGAVDGLEYLRGGLSYENALEKHLEKLEATKLKADEDKASAETKLAALNLGELAAVDTGKATNDEKPGPGTFADNFRAAMGKTTPAGR